MSNWALVTVSFLYIYTGIVTVVHGGNWNWLGFWSCYAAANYFWLRALT